MKLAQAHAIAEKTMLELSPHCHRIAIAGSIRRKCEDVNDIELVAIPKPYQNGLFQDGIAPVVNQWEKVKGDIEYGKCKYTQRILPEGIKLDLFFAEPGNWGLIYAIRTGSAAYSHHILACEWAKRGYRSIGGYLHTGTKCYETREEKDLFERLGVKYVEPEFRNL